MTPKQNCGLSILIVKGRQQLYGYRMQLGWMSEIKHIVCQVIAKCSNISSYLMLSCSVFYIVCAATENAQNQSVNFS